MGDFQFSLTGSEFFIHISEAGISSKLVSLHHICTILSVL
jgi:hypothetical protein